MITTAWGHAELVEEVTVAQANEFKPFTTHIQLLKSENGDDLVRFAYATDETTRRGPVTLRAVDLKRLAKALTKTPKLRAHLAKFSTG